MTSNIQFNVGDTGVKEEITLFIDEVCLRIGKEKGQKINKGLFFRAMVDFSELNIVAFENYLRMAIVTQEINPDPARDDVVTTNDNLARVIDGHPLRGKPEVQNDDSEIIKNLISNGVLKVCTVCNTPTQASIMVGSLCQKCHEIEVNVD